MSTGFEYKKIRQHFVSRFYLKAWSENDTHVVARDDTHVFGPKFEQVAVSKDTYRVEGLSQEQEKLLLAELDKVKSPMASLLRTLIEKCAQLRDETPLDGKIGKVDVDIFKSNVIENVYSLTEDVVQDAYDFLADGEYNKINIFEYENVLRFLFNQLTRSEGSRHKIREEIGHILEEKGIGFDAYNMFSSIILAEQLVIAVMEQLYRITVIENNTSVRFITGDWPVVNLKSEKDKTIEMYWPITPYRAVLVNPTNFPHDQAAAIKKEMLSGKGTHRYFLNHRIEDDPDVIRALNRVIWSRKHRCVFGVDEADVRAADS
ncbi:MULTISPECIES: DUF4238 domain-containing protein [unclassified Cupriavidus]|uniref:DUF4238 domain-containing protein n=1 Tax=Cupriavidus sp. H19C3 TaxID=3241603 RepID=UPI003BF8AA7F